MRIFYVLRKDLEDDRKSLINYVLTIFAILTTTALIQAIILRFNPLADNEEIYSGFFYGFLFLGGAILISLLFREDLFTRVNTHQFLMLPASPEEKFFSRALIGAVLYPVALTILFMGTSLIIEPLFYLIFRDRITLFNPWSMNILTTGLNYFTLSSIFFLGSIYFRKLHFFKTIFSTLAVLLSFGIIAALLGRLIFNECFTGITINTEVNYSLSSRDFPLKAMEWIGKIFYFIVLPLFCYTVAFLRLKEVEATDAIS